MADKIKTDEPQAGEPKSAAADKPARVARDNRVIHSGVTLNDGVTYAGDDPDVLDELEKALTKKEHERLIEVGAISGDWTPGGGDEPPPMAGSRMARMSAEQRQQYEADQERRQRIARKRKTASEMSGFGNVDKPAHQTGREAEPEAPATPAATTATPSKATPAKPSR